MTVRLRTILIISLIILYSLFTFRGIWNTYFQQDEWNGFGKVIYAQQYGYWSLVRLYGSHFTPLSSLFFAFLFNTFGYDARGYAWYSLLLHSVNGILVYILALKISKRVPVGLFAACWFISAYVSSQAVLWFAASSSFLPAVFFSLLSLILFENYLKSQKIVWLYKSIAFCFIALGFRENVVFLFGYFIFRTYIMKRQLFNKTAYITTIAGIVYLISRFLPALQSKTTFMHNNIGSILVQALEFMFISLPQMLITRSMSIDFFRWIMELPISYIQHIGTSTNVPLLIETVLFRWFFIFLWSLLAIFLYFFVKLKVKIKKEKQNIFSIIIFLLLSVLPFSLLPRNLFMESRHFYLSAVGFAILMGFVFNTYILRVHRYVKFFVIFLYIGIVLVNTNLIQKGIRQGIVMSRIRQHVVSKLASFYPTISTKALFFSEGDTLPFQSGDGYKLMVLYHDKQSYQPLLKEDFLWNIGSQGYREVNSTGFGYFREYDKLFETYCNEHLVKENVFSFYWDESNKKLYDTSERTRKKLTVCI